MSQPTSHPMADLKPTTAHLEGQDDIEKGTTDHFEEFQKPAPFVYVNEDEGEKPRTGLRRLLKRAPSVEFMTELDAMNQQPLNPAEVKKIERKISWLIVPALSICYLFYYVDKTTLSYAALFTIKADLKLGTSEYSWLSSLFYFGWIAWAFPTNLLMAKFPLAKYLAVNIILWGVFLMLQGAVSNFAGLAALRVISGAFEATADPAFVLITGTWFTRRQVPVVIGIWYSFNGIGIAFGGLFGYGIGHITGAIASWRWEFILIGLACLLWGIFMYIVIPDAPHTTRFLNRREALVVMSRKRDDGGSVEKRGLKYDQFVDFLKDPKSYLFFMLGLSANVPNGGTSNFGTLVVKGFGFNTLNTTLLQIPYGAFIALMIYMAIFVNYKTNHLGIRTYLMAGVTCLTVLGFALVRYAEGTAPRLIGYYLTGSSNAVFVLALSLVSSNIGGTTKKALTSAGIFFGVALGNIIGPFLFIDAQAPTYSTGIIGCMTSRAVEIVVILLLRVCFVRGNRVRQAKLDAGDQSADPNYPTYEDVSDTKNMRFRYIT